MEKYAVPDGSTFFPASPAPAQNVAANAPMDTVEFQRRKRVYLMGRPAMYTPGGLLKLSYLVATVHPKCLCIIEPLKKFFGGYVDIVDDRRVYEQNGHYRIPGRYLTTEVDMNA